MIKKTSDSETIQAESARHFLSFFLFFFFLEEATHERGNQSRRLFFLCGNLTLNGPHQPHTHTENQTNYNLSFLFCPFHSAPFLIPTKNTVKKRRVVGV